MALPPSTANWHWKNKNVTPWGTKWFERELTSITINGDKEGEVVLISNVTDVDGDIELGQRKSKLITIFDCKVSMKWEGTASDGTEVNGTLTIPEVSHEIICDKLSDFVFEWSLNTASSPEVNALYSLAKARLPTAIETKLAAFPSAIIQTHGKDLTVSADPSRSGTPAPSTTATAAPAVAASSSTVTSAPTKAPTKKTETINTRTVTVEATFQASADDLFSLLTDEKRIPMWTRAPAVSNPKPEAEFSLFGGGVKGKYISLTKPSLIEQTWALQSPTWPSGHFAKMTTTIAQSTDSTKVTFRLEGVPTGMEDEIKRNIEGYYIHGFKSIGYVQLITAEPVYSSSYDEARKRSQKLTKTSEHEAKQSYLPVVIITTLVLVAAFSIPYFSSRPLSPSSK